MRRIGFVFLVMVMSAILAVSMIISGCGETEKTNRMLVGRWVSPEREYITNADESVYYIVRDYTFTDDAFRVVTTVYGDPVSDIKFYTAVVDGTYRLTGESTAVEGATDIEFTFAQITIEPNLMAFVDILMRSGCGDGLWGLDVPQDVSDTGCLSYRSITDYPTEYNIIQIVNDSLQMGMRPKDDDLGSPEKRPTVLSRNVLIRHIEQ